IISSITLPNPKWIIVPLRSRQIYRHWQVPRYQFHWSKNVCPALPFPVQKSLDHLGEQPTTSNKNRAQTIRVFVVKPATCNQESTTANKIKEPHTIRVFAVK